MPRGSIQTGNHGTTPPSGWGRSVVITCLDNRRAAQRGRTLVERKGEVDSDSLFRVFRWIPWLISDSPGAAIGCCPVRQQKCIDASYEVQKVLIAKRGRKANNTRSSAKARNSGSG